MPIHLDDRYYELKAGNMPASRFTLDLGLQSGWLPMEVAP
jgi:hypothetical protein